MTHEYPWFDQVPSNLKTRRQLADLGLRPGGPVRGRVVWKRGKRFADLFDQVEALPKQAPTEAQLAALQKANEARRTCANCKTVLPYILGRYDECPVCGPQVQERGAELAEVQRKARLWLADSLILDTETTDLNGYLVQIAILDTAGGVLLDTLINPEAPISEGAHRVHGLALSDLAGAPTFADILPQLRTLLPERRRVVVYNAGFDMGILYNEISRLARGDDERFHELDLWLRGLRWRCAMELYAEWIGDWSDYHGNYRWQALPGGDHTAVGDCRATLAIVHEMAEPGEDKSA